MMTVDEVKRDLPPVLMIWEGRKYWARVSGRCCPFACVSPTQPIDNKKYVRTIIGPCFRYAWETVTNAVNTGKPLRV